jgi:hypothetical protein
MSPLEKKSNNAPVNLANSILEKGRYHLTMVYLDNLGNGFSNKYKKIIK